MSLRKKRLRALTRQIERLARRIEQLQATSRQLATIRLALMLMGLALAVAFYWRWGWQEAGGIFLLVVIGFGVVVWQHRRVDGTLTQMQILQAIKRSHVARMELDWEQMPPPLLVPAEQIRPIERDFNLLGEHSLHRLINTTVSAESAQRLRTWLSITIPDEQTIAKRRELVQELIPQPLLRDKLTLMATDNDQIDSASIKQVVGSTTEAISRHAVWGLSTLAGVNLLLFWLAQQQVIGSWWLLLTFTLYVLLSLRHLQSAGPIFQEAAQLRDLLERLLSIFVLLERYSYRRTPRLRELCHPYVTGAPTKLLRQVRWVLAGTGLRGNAILWLALNVIFPWDIMFAYLFQGYKIQLRQQLPQWLDVWFEVEALSALATFAWLNPHYTFAELVSTQSPLDAIQLGHPLILHEQRVSNDFAVTEIGTINLFTGSNMAGKSTFLRTVGANVLLAYAGTVVVAERLRFRPMQLATCIQITDSVTDGFSYFYAEVNCLRTLLATLEKESDLPLLYFIDEIFRGTNNRERLIGSRSLINAIVGKDGIGLLSTHDLELAALAKSSNSIRNYHFRDEVVAGEMLFDYQLHTGPCPTTNALRIMQQAGLPVEL